LNDFEFHGVSPYLFFIYIIQFRPKNVNSFASQNQLIELIEKTGFYAEYPPKTTTYRKTLENKSGKRYNITDKAKGRCSRITVSEIFAGETKKRRLYFKNDRLSEIA
jgi:hypothetical protein